MIKCQQVAVSVFFRWERVEKLETFVVFCIKIRRPSNSKVLKHLFILGVNFTKQFVQSIKSSVLFHQQLHQTMTTYLQRTRCAKKTVSEIDPCFLKKV